MTTQIAIIGAGQIGSRHLQALALIKRDIAVSAFDPNQKSLNMAKQRFEEMPKSTFVRTVSYFESLDKLPRAVDIAIISTSADIRKAVIEQLLLNVKVRFCILEKVAFQSTEDFEFILGLFKKQNIKAWVNCSCRRQNPFYQELRANLQAGQKVFLSVWGGDWGMACNSIHFLDLFSYLTGETNIHLDASGLDSTILKSKREGFVEFSGILKGKTGQGSEISLLDCKDSTAPYVIQVAGLQAQYIIFEPEGKARLALKKDNWAWKDTSFPIIYQSQLTHHLIEQILDTNDCMLAPIEESFILHQRMLEAFINHLKKATGKIYENCPIT